MPPSPRTHPLDGLTERGVSQQTVRVYKSAWLSFAQWCEEEAQRRGREVVALPAEPVTVRDYLVAEAPQKAYSSLRRARRAIELAHELCGYASPLGDERVEQAWAGLLDEGSPLYEAPSTGGVRSVQLADQLHPHVIRMLDELPDSLVGIRDRAVLLTGAAGSLSRPELVGLKANNVIVQEGRVVLHVPSDGAARAVDVDDETEHLVRALRSWLKASKIKEGPLFRPLRRGGHVADKPLTPQALTVVLRRAAKRAGLPREAATTELFGYERGV
jgi:site-specific recombinase XerD